VPAKRWRTFADIESRAVAHSLAFCARALASRLAFAAMASGITRARHAKGEREGESEFEETPPRGKLDESGARYGRWQREKERERERERGAIPELIIARGCSPLLQHAIASACAEQKKKRRSSSRDALGALG